MNQLRKEWVTTKGIALEDFLILTLFVLQKSRSEFFHEENHLLSDEQYKKLLTLLERRHKKEPVAYLVGSKEFFGREFLVTSHTLIPRPETECLVENVLDTFYTTKQPDAIFDIGTGSGVIAVTLAQELKDFPLSILASDTSQEALATAERNADIHNVTPTFLAGSLLEPYQSYFSSFQEVYIVANLPYVSEALLQKATSDVKDYEPRTALVSESEGLAHYQALLEQIQKSPLTGTAWLEISPEQSQILANEIKTFFPRTQLFIGQDLSGRDRFLRFTF